MWEQSQRQKLEQTEGTGDSGRWSPPSWADVGLTQLEPTRYFCPFGVEGLIGVASLHRQDRHHSLTLVKLHTVYSFPPTGGFQSGDGILVGVVVFPLIVS